MAVLSAVTPATCKGEEGFRQLLFDSKSKTRASNTFAKLSFEMLSKKDFAVTHSVNRLSHSPEIFSEEQCS
jgi:hypothetical protein